MYKTADKATISDNIIDYHNNRIILRLDLHQ